MRRSAADVQEKWSLGRPAAAPEIHQSINDVQPPYCQVDPQTRPLTPAFLLAMKTNEMAAVDPSLKIRWDQTANGKKQAAGSAFLRYFHRLVTYDVSEPELVGSQGRELSA